METVVLLLLGWVMQGHLETHPLVDQVVKDTLPMVNFLVLYLVKENLSLQLLELSINNVLLQNMILCSFYTRWTRAGQPVMVLT